MNRETGEPAIGWKATALLLDAELERLRAAVDRLDAETQRMREDQPHEALRPEHVAERERILLDENDRLRRERNDYFAEVERLKEWKKTHLERYDEVLSAWHRAGDIIGRVRKVRDNTELANHSSRLWQLLDAALDGETDG